MKKLREKSAWLVLKHSVLSKILGVLFLILLLWALSVLKAPLWVIAAVMLFYTFVIFASVWGAYVIILNPAVEQLNNNCDCEPLQYVSESMLKYIKKGSRRQIALINLCVVMIEKGEYKKAAESLENINIDREANDMATKYTYYNNLSEAYGALGDKEKFNVWAKKANQIYDSLPVKLREQYVNSFKMSAVRALLFEDKYNEALDMLNSIAPKYQRSNLSKMMLEAETYIALSKPECAKTKLEYVISNGKKLYCVTEAEALLEKLN